MGTLVRSVLMLVTLAVVPLAAAPAAGEISHAYVTRVVDGDTIVIDRGRGQERLRYIGVDTPETRHPRKGLQCFGRAASAYNARLVDAEPVRLAGDVQERDRLGRRLAYVYRIRDGLFVNAELVRGGFARTLTIPPNIRFAARFAAVAADARRARRGLWSACARA